MLGGKRFTGVTSIDDQKTYKQDGAILKSLGIKKIKNIINKII